MRVGVLTGGGDCPGLNAVIRAVVRKGTKGSISIPFSSDDELARLLEKIGIKL